MIRSFRAALLALGLACAPLAVPAHAQQVQGASASVTTTTAGPRVHDAMPRVDARFKNSTRSTFMQEGDVSHSYLVYLLVVAVLVVLLIFLIKRA